MQAQGRRSEDRPAVITKGSMIPPLNGLPDNIQTGDLAAWKAMRRALRLSLAKLDESMQPQPVSNRKLYILAHLQVAHREMAHCEGLLLDEIASLEKESEEPWL
jgi:hypothetical protein